MKIFALLAFAWAFFAASSSGLYLYNRQSLPAGTKYSIRTNTDLLSFKPQEGTPPKIVPGTFSLDGNDPVIAGEPEKLDGSSLLSSIQQGYDSWNADGIEDISFFDDKGDDVETQGFIGYAPSQHVPFRVQVKARDSILDSEIGKVPNSDVSKADDPSKGDAGLLTSKPGGKSDSPEGIILASASGPDSTSADGTSQSAAGTVAEDGTAGLGSGLPFGGDLTGTDLGLQGQDTPLVIGAGAGLDAGDVNSALTLALADVAPSSGNSKLGLQTDTGDFVLPSLRLSDSPFTDSTGPLANSGVSAGSLFASVSSTIPDNDLFSDAAPSKQAANDGSLFFPGDSAATRPNNDQDRDSSTNSQDESYLRNIDQGDPSDPCLLVHGSAVPFLGLCSASTTRTVYEEFKTPAVPRPDSDIAVDNIAKLRL